jgi:long-chain acyl-CoA synthetase
MTLRTLNDVFFTMMERNSSRVMLNRENGVWKTISAVQIRNWVYATARQLQAWGVKKGDRVILLSENRPEWAIADFACLLLGAADVPIYATQTAEQCLFVIRNSEARIAFVSSRKQYEKLAAIREQTNLKYIVIMDDAPEIDEAIPMQSFLRSAPDKDDLELEEIGHRVEPDDLATLIYTSGTTGTPKGVMLTHGNIASNLSVSLDMYEFDKNDLCVSFLPLSHVTARHLDYALMNAGVPLAYCPVIDELPQVMKEVQPTLIVAVPRVYEKIYNAVQNKSHGIKRKLIQWALSVGAKNRDTILRGETPTSFSWRMADKVVFSKIREGLGGRAGFAFTRATD